MKILTTGAGGLVGRALSRSLPASNAVIAAGHSELDITNAEAVNKFVAENCPNLIINCAVIGFDECETNPDKASAVNVDGPANLAKAANECGAAIVHFSTNYVFDGDRDSGFYTIDDEPRPVSNYGRTKWQGEQVVASECSRSFIIRTSWIYGGGKNSFFDNAIAALRKGETVRGIADNWASTTFVDDLVVRVGQIIDRGIYGTYHVVNNGVCSKYEFAVEAARIICGSDKLVEPDNEVDSGLAGKRPRYTPMRCKLTEEIGLPPMRDWQQALLNYLI